MTLLQKLAAIVAAMDDILAKTAAVQTALSDLSLFLDTV